MALNREKIIVAAIQLAKKDGLESLSMRKLASKLKIEAMSLYYHFKNKDQILSALVDHAFKLIDWKPDKNNWKTSARDRCVSLRKVLNANPWAVSLLDSRRNPGLETLKHHDQMLGLFRQNGFSLKLTAHAYAILDSYVFGFAVQENSLPVSNSDDIAEMSESIFSDMPPDFIPHMMEMTMNYYMKPGYSFAAEFDFGLDLVLDGIEKEFNEERQYSKELI
tara:strand:- start:9914 stop:10576 length:663 start_codon:yes stop_codon:yes gene_type:complete